jgi:hypothetical protein
MNKEEVYPHKEIALASAAIAALPPRAGKYFGAAGRSRRPNRRNGVTRESAARCEPRAAAGNVPDLNDSWRSNPGKTLPEYSENHL